MKLIPFILFAILITACGPSAEQITAIAAEAQARTQTAAPTPTATQTQTPEPTNTPPPTFTPTPITSCGEGQEVDVTRGTFDCAEYVSAEGNFSCRLNLMLTFMFEPTLGYSMVTDYPIESGWNGGGFFAQNLAGDQYYVEYFSYSHLPDEVKTLLDEPGTKEEGLNRIFVELLQPARSSSLKSVESVEYLEDDILEVTLILGPGNNGGYMIEFTYIFVEEDYFYFVTVVSPELISAGGDSIPSADGVLFNAYPLYSNCEFSR
jgi:hypothetical protein